MKISKVHKVIMASLLMSTLGGAYLFQNIKTSSLEDNASSKESESIKNEESDVLRETYIKADLEPPECTMPGSPCMMEKVKKAKEELRKGREEVIKNELERNNEHRILAAKRAAEIETGGNAEIELTKVQYLELLTEKYPDNFIDFTAMEEGDLANSSLSQYLPYWDHNSKIYKTDTAKIIEGLFAKENYFTLRVPLNYKSDSQFSHEIKLNSYLFNKERSFIRCNDNYNNISFLDYGNGHNKMSLRLRYSKYMFVDIEMYIDPGNNEILFINSLDEFGRSPRRTGALNNKVLPF